MDEFSTAANTEVEITTTESFATSTDTEQDAPTADTNTEETTPSAPEQPAPTDKQPAELTQTQIVAKRIKEERAKIERELQDKQTQEKSARDSRIAAKGYVDSQGNPITTEQAYWDELDRKAQVDAYIAKGNDPEVARVMYENQLLKQKEAERAKTEAAETARRRDLTDFLAAYKEFNGRDFDSKTDKLPPEVVTTAKNGVPLKYAYADYFAKQKLEKEKSLATGNTTKEANATNAATAAGSVVGNGASENSVLTEEAIANMTPKQLASRWADVKKALNMK